MKPYRSRFRVYIYSADRYEADHRARVIICRDYSNHLIRTINCALLPVEMWRLPSVLRDYAQPVTK